jgi:hypothetical protein
MKDWPEPYPIIGVELGARMENTALCVVEHDYLGLGECEDRSVYDRETGQYDIVTHEKVAPQYRVRHLERRRPPVRYKGVAERVAELVRAVGNCLLVVDVTRTGRPVYSLILKAVLEELRDVRRAQITHDAITISGIAGGVTHSPDIGYLVPRRDLVSQALLLFESDQLKIAQDLDLAQTLTEEFLNFKPQEDPKDDLAGWRLAKNDDLVLGVAISVWVAERFLRKETYLSVEESLA